MKKKVYTLNKLLEKCVLRKGSSALESEIPMKRLEKNICLRNLNSKDSMIDSMLL